MAKKTEKKEEKDIVINTKDFLKENVGKEFAIDGSEDVWGEITKETKYYKKGHTEKFSPIIFAKLQASGVVKQIKEPKK